MIESFVDSDPKSDVDSDSDESGESGVGGVITIKSESSWRSPEVLLISMSELCSSKYLFHASQTFCDNSVICSSRKALSDCQGITDCSDNNKTNFIIMVIYGFFSTNV